MYIFPFWTLQTGTVHHPFWWRLFLLSPLRVLPGGEPHGPQDGPFKVFFYGAQWFWKGNNFFFLPYGYNQVRIPSNLRWGSFKLIFMAQNNFEEGENFWWQRRKSCQSLLCLSETRWCTMFLTKKKKKTMSIIHLQRRKLPMDAHLAPLILSNAPKLLTSKHFQRITKGKQGL